MTVGLVMIAKDAQDTIGASLRSVHGLIDTWTILDTGSTDDTPEIIQEALQDVPGVVVNAPFDGFAQARTSVLEYARGTADWLLMMDSDMTAHAADGLRDWLADDQPPEIRDPSVTAWNVEISGQGLRWRLPWLMLGDRDWRYEGVTHSYLVGDGARRNLRGLLLRHHGSYSVEKMARDIDLLAPGVAEGDPRSVYYMGWALKAVGRTVEAAEMFDRRAGMGGFEEEAWHAQYFAALLRDDVAGLLAAYKRRPWRHEPLAQAARIIQARGQNDDVLFIEGED